MKQNRKMQKTIIAHGLQFEVPSLVQHQVSMRIRKVLLIDKFYNVNVMKKFCFTALLCLSVCINIYAQPNEAKWGLTNNLNLISVKGFNSYLSVPDIKDSNADIEIRLYANGIHSYLRSITSMAYKNGQWSAIYYSRKDRRVDDPIDSVFPINVYQIKDKNLDSVFVGLAKHNIFILPDQSQTSRPKNLSQFIILVKSNEQIRTYSFEGVGLINNQDNQEFREYKSIVELFSYLNNGFLEKI